VLRRAHARGRSYALLLLLLCQLLRRRQGLEAVHARGRAPLHGQATTAAATGHRHAGLTASGCSHRVRSLVHSENREKTIVVCCAEGNANGLRRGGSIRINCEFEGKNVDLDQRDGAFS
jgi:hypothetical protein